MSISINTNIASLQAQNYLRQTENFQQQTIDEVTSGLRIINSGDDAAGLAIANGLRSDQAVLTQGIQNANNGLSTLQTIDGGMTNISQLLDRARTLATESASGTFTGDRNTLDSEFQSVLGEVNRQAQAIGLDSGGEFAKSLSVFIGGGQAQGNTSAIQNGSVAVDLSNATVDAKSLGLSGVQVIGGTAGTTDIGTGSQYTSVSQILSNTANTTAAGGYTSFIFAGPGFSDGSKVAISVNTQNVTDADSLVTAINDAIQNAGNAGTQAATAFQNANIVASVNTDSSGKQQIAFSSSGTAFQVTAGDRMANALMGQFAGANSSTGAAMATTVTGGANVTLTNTASAAETVKVQFTGAGLTAPLDLGVAVTNGESVQNVVNSLSSAVVNNSTLKAAGITLNPVTTGNPLTFSDSLGQQFSVVAGGDTQNLLGLGTSQLGLSNAVTYNTLTAGASYSPASSGMANLEFSLDGAASGGTAGSVTGTAIGAQVNMTGKTLGLTVNGTQFNVAFNNDPNVGAGETQQQIVNYINSTAQTALGLGAGVNVASVANNLITLTSPTAGASSTVVVAAGAGATALGFTGGATNTGTGNTSVSVSLAGGTATAASATGSAVASTFATQAFSASVTGASLGVTAPTFDTNTAPPSITITIDGTAHVVNFGGDVNKSATETLADVVVYIDISLGGGGHATLAGTNQIKITSGSTGAGSDVQITRSAFTDSLGLTNGSSVDSGTGAAALTTLGLTIDGQAVTANFANDTNKGAAESLANVAAFINQQAEQQLGTSATIATVVNNAIKLASGTTGASSSVAATASATQTALGLSTSTTTGAAPTGADIANRLNQAFAENATLQAAGLQARFANGSFTVSSTNGTNFQLNARGQTGADLGFGTAGAAFMGNAATSANNTTFDAGGSSAVSLAFTGLVNGSDNQAITISATDGSGNVQTKTITLANNATGTSGSTIDQAVSAINTALQQSNNSTLQQITAVKEDVGGTENINLLSTLGSFSVSLGTTADGTGLSDVINNVKTQGTTASSATLAGGSTVAITSQAGAEASVAALATAVTNLGNAQATVGKGENEFNYAINLAQTQNTNEASAESQIRDADMASEAANLTKAQILQQAGIAALAQANSAPQAVLTLLQR